MWKKTSFAIKCQKFDEKRPQSSEKINFSVFLHIEPSARGSLCNHILDIVTRDPQLWISPVLCRIFQFFWVHLKAVRVLNMTAKSQVNSFYSSRAILIHRFAGSRLIKHSLEKIWPVPKKLLQANIPNQKQRENRNWQSI